MGSFVKTLVANAAKSSPNNVYHATIMPCPDKKLEASREDFYSDVYQTRDVDLVLTSTDVSYIQYSNLALIDLVPTQYAYSTRTSTVPRAVFPWGFLFGGHILRLRRPRHLESLGATQCNSAVAAVTPCHTVTLLAAIQVRRMRVSTVYP